MDVGMLWFDNDPQQDLLEKIQKAAIYYQRKYRHAPNVCYVHPSMIPDLQAQMGAIMVRSRITILPHHFWIGYQQKDVSSSDTGQVIKQL